MDERQTITREAPYSCPECGETFANGHKLGGHLTGCDPETDRRLAAAYLAGATVAQVAYRFEVGDVRVRSALKRTNTPYRRRSKESTPGVEAAPKPITYAKDRFRGRCGACLARVDGEHECVRVRVLSMSDS